MLRCGTLAGVRLAFYQPRGFSRCSSAVGQIWVMSTEQNPRMRFRRFETFITIVLIGLAILMPVLMWGRLL
jgi:hypothetical protein